ncbi:MAG: response regulator [Acidobacteriota bacterium]|nr:response regulator [Acidobacteriota bacterium]
MKLLIVEDNQQMRRLIASIVSDLAEEISECSDGSQALAAYTEQQPDWVLIDIRMQEMDGIAATVQIKSAFPEAHIMIVTDYDDARLREAADVAGACAYVLKENLSAMRNIINQSGVCA